MESLGTLAGGIAHDFNNLLAVINGYAELSHAPPDDPASSRKASGRSGAPSQRATGLVRQILTFSRKARGSLRAGGHEPADPGPDRASRPRRSRGRSRSTSRPPRRASDAPGRPEPAPAGRAQPLRERAGRDAGGRHDLGDDQRGHQRANARLQRSRPEKSYVCLLVERHRDRHVPRG